MRRRVVLTVSSAGLLLLAAAIYASVVFLFLRPVGTGPAGPAVPRAAFDHAWTRRPVKLVGMGDSIAAGFGSTHGHSFFDRLAHNPADEFPEMRGIDLATVLPNLEVVNIAVSGSTSIEHLDSQLSRLPTQDPSTLGLIVLTTGGNDLIHNYGRTPPREGAMYGASAAEAAPWIRSFASRLDRLIQGIEERFPGGCHIFLTTIYDPTDGVGDIQNAGLPAWKEGLSVLQAYNDVLSQASEKHRSVHLVDIRTAFLGHGIHCTQFWRSTYQRDDPHYWYFDNLEDPNDRGYDAIRRLVLLEMSKVVPEPSSATPPAPREQSPKTKP